MASIYLEARCQWLGRLQHVGCVAGMHMHESASVCVAPAFRQ
jgi:hypothetical protein